MTSLRLVCVACAASEPSDLDSYSIGAASDQLPAGSLSWRSLSPRSSSQPKKGSSAYPSLCSSIEYLVRMCGTASTQPCIGLERSGSGSTVTFFQRLRMCLSSIFAHDSKLG